jgi:antitoxin (DNA-binding transcriptional repressor) of toxin-antitoxin stability system
MVINIYEAKTQLSRLLREVAMGREVVIARDGIPLAKLVPFVSQPTHRVPEIAKDLIVVAPDWDSDETNAEVAALLARSKADKPRKPHRSKAKRSI